MPTPVPFVALDRQHGPLRAELSAAFERVVDTSGFILGEEVARFEEELARFCGTRHCVGVASGTAALTLAVQAAGVEPGDEVIVPAHTYIASALGVLHAGAQPVFCDVDPGTGLIDAESAASLVGERTAAILPVHLYGQACAMDALDELADRHGLAVIEDAAQAVGADWRGRPVGSLGTAAAFSFYPSKNLGALGDGGAICTDDDAIAQRARELRNIGQRGKGEHVSRGWNERLDGLQAAMLRVKLPHVPGWNSRRREHAAAYRDAFAGSALQLLEERPDSPCVYHLFPVRSDDRDGLALRLRERGIATGLHYTPAVVDQPPFAASRRADDVATARAWAATELSLPMFEHLSRAEVDWVTSAVTDVAGPGAGDVAAGVAPSD